MENKFESYGDVNFFDGGILIREVSENRYEIITCYVNSDEEDSYLLTYGEVDITDDFIDKHDVCSYSSLRDVSIDYTDEEKKLFAIAVVDYYGSSCSEIVQSFLSKNEIIDKIDSYINDIEWEYYESNFFNKRNCVVEICNNYGNNGKYVYNSLEDAMEDFSRKAESGWSIEIISI